MFEHHDLNKFDIIDLHERVCATFSILNSPHVSYDRTQNMTQHFDQDNIITIFCDTTAEYIFQILKHKYDRIPSTVMGSGFDHTTRDVITTTMAGFEEMLEHCTQRLKMFYDTTYSELLYQRLKSRSFTLERNAVSDDPRFKPYYHAHTNPEFCKQSTEYKIYYLLSSIPNMQTVVNKRINTFTQIADADTIMYLTLTGVAQHILRMFSNIFYNQCPDRIVPNAIYQMYKNLPLVTIDDPLVSLPITNDASPISNNLKMTNVHDFLFNTDDISNCHNTILSNYKKVFLY